MVKDGICFVLEIIAALASGAGQSDFFVVALYTLDFFRGLLFFLFLILLVMSIIDTAFGDKWVRVRRSLNIILRTLMVTRIVLGCAHLGSFFSYNHVLIRGCAMGETILEHLLFFGFPVILITAHYKMHQVRDNMYSSIMNIVHITAVITSTPSTASHDHHMHHH